MNIKAFLSLLLLLVIPFFTITGQQISNVTFEGKFSSLSLDNSEPSGITYPRSKQIRMSSEKGGQLKAVYDESVMKALHPLVPSIINHATKLWEEKIYIPENIVIEIDFELGEMGDDLAFYGDVSYHEKNAIRYPISLIKTYFNEPLAVGTSLITLNNNSSIWYFDGDNDNPTIQGEQYDFKTAVLRSIAQALGFVTTIKNRRGSLLFAGEARTIYEKYVISNNKALADINIEANSELLTFATSNNVYWNNNPNYKLFAPTTYEPEYSLNYFDSQNELMSAHFKAQKGVWDIDDKTTKVLEDIGWKIPISSIKILSNNIGNNGIGSIHNSYSFYISPSSTFSSYQWEYKIRLKNGGYQTIKTGNTSTFSISPVTPVDSYYRNSEGDVAAKIDVRAVSGGRTYETTFNLSLECKPANINYEVNIIKESDWYYNIEIVFSSEGAKNLLSSVTNYGIGEILTTSFLNKQYAKYTTHYFSYGYPVIINFRSENAYGATTMSHYIEPFDYWSTKSITSNSQNRLNNLNTETKIEVIDMNGFTITTIPSIEDIKQLESGIHFLRIHNNDRSITVKKIIK